MSLLIILGIVALLIWTFSHNNSGTKYRQELGRRNQQWVDFIAGYLRVAHTPKEKALIARMLSDIAAQNLAEPTIAKVSNVEATPRVGVADSTSVNVADTYTEHSLSTATGSDSKNLLKHTNASIQLDNASLLLYFGAFLFIASAGLFVSFGGASGSVRTAVVILVTMLMYSSGIWIYRNQPKLKQAGQAFAGIGVVLAPLIGGALYSYVFSESHGMLIWVLTSLFCLAMYSHALLVFRSSLMSYLLIFTFLSLFESGVGIAATPVYYYGWGLAFFAILLQLSRYHRGGSRELHDASNLSADIMLPIALLISAITVPAQGVLQLGISLLLVAAFYGLETMRTIDKEREMDAAMSQVSAALGVVAITYGATDSLFAAGVSALAVNLVQLVLMSIYKKNNKLWRNFASVLLTMSLVSLFLDVMFSGLLLAGVSLLLITSAVIWLIQRREDAYSLSVLSWMAILFVGGQLTFGPLSATWQSVVAYLGLLVVLCTYLMKNFITKTSFAVARTEAYLIAASSVLACAMFAPPVVTLLMTLAVAATFLTLEWQRKRGEWVDLAGIVLFLPILRSLHSADILLVSAAVALILLITLSLRYRRETLRWASTIAWLLMPLSLGSARFGGHWFAVKYMWAYLVVMACLIISRSVARGVIYLSSRIPMASYARSASLSYVFGYVISGISAVCVSLITPSSQLNTSLVLGVLALTTVLLAVVIEKRDEIFTFLVVIVQALIISALRPSDSLHMTQLYLMLSPIFAIVSYFVFAIMPRTKREREGLKSILQVAVATAFIAPLSFIFGIEMHWLMAIGLLVASSLLIYHIRTTSEEDKELAGVLVVLAIWWLFFFGHITNLQAYVHVVVVMFALYAYRRYRLLDRVQSDNYLWYMMATATIPLAIQAIYSSSILYGWWLLGEQVVIMLLGMTVQRGFVTRWGLYFSLATVLYQLRDLGYAALGVLAVFLIALAIYKLQKYNDPKS